MKFGYFDDRNKEYVITTPQTPLPWINYLGSEDFFSLVSNTAGGYSFYRDARMRRLTRYRYNNSPLDMDGHRIYIKDGDTVWNPGWQPTKTPLDSYSCRHGLGYTVVEGKKDGVTARQELFVPKGDACELDRVTVCNESAAVKELDLFSYVEFCLWDAVDDSSNFQRNYSTGEVEVEGSVIYHKTEYRERRNHYAVFWANCPVDSFDTTPGCLLRGIRRPGRPASRPRRALFRQHCSRLGTGGCAAHPPEPCSRRKPQHPVRSGLHRKPAAGKVHRAGCHQQDPRPRHDGALRHRRTDRCRPHRPAHPLGGAAVHLPSGIRRGKAEPHGQYLASVPVHGHL